MWVRISPSAPSACLFEWLMKSVQKTDDRRLSEGSNPSASATALILCGIRAVEGFFFCFSLWISDSNGVNGRVFLIIHTFAVWQIAPNGIGFHAQFFCNFRNFENTLILFRCNIPISRPCSANCGLDSYQSLKAECFIYSCKALVRKFTESVRKSNGRILLKGTNPSANVTISKVSDCS